MLDIYLPHIFSATMDMNGESMGPYSHRTPEAAKYWELVDKNRQDFDSWYTLIGVVEREVLILPITGLSLMAP